MSFDFRIECLRPAIAGSPGWHQVSLAKLNCSRLAENQ
jgi:hypothetical protein